MKKILVTSTNLMMRQFLVPHVNNLCQHGCLVEVACSHVGGDFEELEDIFQGTVKIHRVSLYRNPIKPGNFKGLIQLRKIIKNGHFDLVWTNEPVMGVMTRLAAAQERKRGLKVIYMVHGFHFFKGSPLKNWFLYYPIEKIMSYLTDTLVTINKEDYALAQRKMHAGRVEYIPGIGIDTKKFAPNLLSKEEKKKIRSGLGLNVGDKMLLSVGELTVRKNHEVVIQALARLRDPNIKYYICGRGELEQKLRKLADKLNLADSVKFLGFRDDISSLCNCADLFVFPSAQEGLSVALMEAIASKIPVICSDIRGNTELVADKEALFGYRDIADIAKKIKEYLYTDKRDKIQQNYENLKKFDLSSVMKEGWLNSSGGGNTSS